MEKNFKVKFNFKDESIPPTETQMFSHEIEDFLNNGLNNPDSVVTTSPGEGKSKKDLKSLEILL